MRVLFFIDPVIYRGGPLEYASHFHWVDLFAKAVAELEGGRFALASSQPLCSAWISGNGPKGEVFPLNSVAVLADFQHDRAAYSAAVYSKEDGKGYLAKELQSVRDRFNPDLILCSFQNSIAAQAFSGVPMVYLEQAPLPRIGHPRRVYFDPSGHQIGSTFEVMRDSILSMRLTTSQAEGGARLLAAVKRQLLEFHPNAPRVADELEKISQIGKVAIFATQPPDGVTYEGAYKRVELEGLICEWAQNLPAGWVGVPTYHFGKSLTIEMEEALSKSLPNVRFLPQNISRDHTELLLLLADGLVTISSTTAMSALLFQKPVIAVGRSPYNSWSKTNIREIEQGEVLSNIDAVRLLVFLTNKFCYSDDEFIINKNLTYELLKEFCSPNYISSLFDISNWNIEYASRLFNFSPEVEGSIGTPSSFRWKSKVRELAGSLASLEKEWAQAVKDRDGVIAENNELREQFDRILLENDTLSARLTSTLAERDQLMSIRAQEAEELESAKALRNSALQELEQARASLNSSESEWRQAVSDRDKVIEENRHLKAEFASLRITVDQAKIQCSVFESEWKQAVSDRDSITSENRILRIALDKEHENLSRLQTELDRQRIYASHTGVFLGELAHVLRMEERVSTVDDGEFPVYASRVVAAVHSLISERASTQLQLNESIKRIDDLKVSSEKTVERLEAGRSILLRKRQASKDILVRYKRFVQRQLSEARAKCSDLYQLNSQLSSDLQLTYASVDGRIATVEGERELLEIKFKSLIDEVASFKANISRTAANIDTTIVPENAKTYVQIIASQDEMPSLVNLDDLGIYIYEMTRGYVELYEKLRAYSKFIYESRLIRLALRLGIIRYGSID
ncbi:hypothetical protein [Asticcacaulis sp.]|uniref:capsular polysaccharide export protein, LipB/KpsS family n=1 Tax=Asticcacaulis sp. TaxID=1872648 RepID=UPI0031D3606C